MNRYKHFYSHFYSTFRSSLLLLLLVATAYVSGCQTEAKIIGGVCQLVLVKSNHYKHRSIMGT